MIGNSLSSKRQPSMKTRLNSLNILLRPFNWVKTLSNHGSYSMQQLNFGTITCLYWRSMTITCGCTRMVSKQWPNVLKLWMEHSFQVIFRLLSTTKSTTNSKRKWMFLQIFRCNSPGFMNIGMRTMMLSEFVIFCWPSNYHRTWGRHLTRLELKLPSKLVSLANRQTKSRYLQKPQLRVLPQSKLKRLKDPAKLIFWPLRFYRTWN